MAREDFSQGTRKLVVDRAGHQCSFPTCQRRTISAGPTADLASGSGVAAHIYAASPGGPRGQGGLTAEELAQPENGIWLCSDHAKLIDNNQGVPFSAETLLSYKALQEARVVREVQGLYSPIGWLHELETFETPVLAPRQKVTFGKLNLFFGPNRSGKTALSEWVCGAFDDRALSRWRTKGTPRLHFRLTYLSPEVHTIDVDSSVAKPPRYTIDSRPVPFNPLGIRVLRLAELRLRDDEDDLARLSSHLRLSPDTIRSLVDEIHAFPHAHLRNLRWDDNEGRTTLYLDCDGTVPNLRLGALSGGETERVFLEFATAAARVSGRYCPTVLILDGCPQILFDGIFEFYSHHWLDPENQFQTILCIPSRKLDLDAIRWQGWEIVRFELGPHGCRLSQDPRNLSSRGHR